METPEKTRVAVVFGGGSTEHAMAGVGATDVLDALDGGEFEIVPFGVTREGQWVLTAGVAAASSADLVPAAGAAVVVEARDGVAGLAGIDVVFPVLQGGFGAEGTIQGLLEMADLPYVGSGVLAASVAADHDFLRKLAVAAGLPVAPYVVLRGAGRTLPGPEAGTGLAEADRVRLGLPVTVRPARGTGGVTLVTDWERLPEAVAAARAVDPKVVVAAAPAGRRLTVGVLDTPDGAGPEASVPGLIEVTGTVAPADVDPETERRLRDLAVEAFVTLDCAGLARVDFVVTADGQVFFDWIDTMPGFAPSAAFPVVWKASGVPYTTLVSRLVKAAVRRGTGLH